MTRKLPIGVQLFSVRQLVDNLNDVCGKIKAIGYEGIEFFGDITTYDPEAVKGIMDNHGLAFYGWHLGLDRFDPENLDYTLDFLSKTGIQNVVVPFLPNPEDDQDQEALKATWGGYAEKMNAAYAALEKQGIGLGYHNHHHEFTATIDGKPVLDYFFSQMNPAIFMQFDTGNAMHGDCDVEAYMKANSDRIFQVHAKPYGKEAVYACTIGEEKDDHNWPAVHEIACNGAVQLYIVEFESEHMDPIEGIEKCYQGLMAVNH